MRLTILFIQFLVIGTPHLLKKYEQHTSIKDLQFLIGTWEAVERNKENTWWEKCTRTGTYMLDSTYIKLESVAVASTGKQRTYSFMIHYDKTAGHFEMIGMYSNWPKIRVEFLDWDSESRTIRLQSKPDGGEYSERVGTIKFNEKFDSYVWTGVNKSGDRLNPAVWEFTERGQRMKY